MKHYLTILIILLIISTATADQVENGGFLDRKSTVIIKPINYTNTTINLTNPINISLNITEPINITDLINITENTTIIIIPINLTNFTELNMTKNETINLTNTSLNITIPLNRINNQTILFSPASNPQTTTYFYAGNKLIATKTNDNINYNYQDHLGSDINSKSLPFGQSIKKEERFSFTGKELDSDLYYFGARYYNPNVGRFTSIDPVKSEPAYQYVKNNPLRFIDPDGKATKDKYQNLIFYSPSMKVTETPLILNFPTQKDVNNYKQNVINPLISSNQKKIVIDIKNGQPISIPGYGESTEFPILGTNLVEPSFKREVNKNGPIENIVFFMHSETNNPQNLILENPFGSRDSREPIVQLTHKLLSLPNNYFDNNGQIIFAICHADSCMDGQAIADSLDVTVYISPGNVEFIEGISPLVIYGQFNEYKPKN